MAEEKVSIALAAETDEFKRRMAEASRDAGKSLDLIEKAQGSAAGKGKEHEAQVRALERATLKGSRAFQKTAIELERVKRMHAGSAEAAALQARATENLTSVLKDQLGRDIANRGRSLSMLFDELRGSLSNLPGPAGDAARALGSVQQAIAGARGGQAGSADVALLAGGYLALASGAIAAGAAVLGLGAKTAATIDSIGDIANQANISAKALSEYRTAAVDFVVPLPDIAKALGVLSKRMFDAGKGSAEQAQMFAALGVKVTDATGALRPANDVMRDMAGVISSVKSETEQVALATTVFGEDLGLKLLPMLKAGTTGMDASARKAREFGLVITDEVLGPTAEYIQASKDLSAQITGIGEAIGRHGIPPLIGMIATVQDAIAMWGRWLTVQGKTPDQHARESAALHKLRLEYQNNQSEIDRLQSASLMWGRTVDANGESIHEQLALLERRNAQLSGQIAVESGLTKETDNGTRSILDRVKALQAEATAKGEKPGVKSATKAKAADTGAADRAAEQALRAQQAFIAAERAILIATEDRVAQQMRLEQERVDEIIRLGQAAGRDAASTEALITEIRRQGAAERASIAEQEAAKQAELNAQQLEAARQLTASRVALAMDAASAIGAIGEALASVGVIQSKRAWQISKAVAVSQALLNAYLAASSAFAQTPGGPVIKSAAAAIAGATGAALAVKVATAPAPVFEHGGPVQGARHRGSGGGVGIMAEGGEVVFSRRDVARHGGQRAVEDMRKGSAAGPTSVTMTLDGRVFGQAVVKQSRKNRDMRRLLRAGPVGVKR